MGHPILRVVERKTMSGPSPLLLMTDKKNRASPFIQLNHTGSSGSLTVKCPYDRPHSVLQTREPRLIRFNFFFPINRFQNGNRECDCCRGVGHIPPDRAVCPSGLDLPSRERNQWVLHGLRYCERHEQHTTEYSSRVHINSSCEGRGTQLYCGGRAYGSPVGATLVGSNWVVPPGFQVAPRGTRTVSAVRPVDPPVRSSMRLASMPFSVVR